MRLMRWVNITLILIALILVINIFWPVDGITGHLSYVIDPSEAECYFVNDGKQSVLPMDLCCFELQQQAECIIADTQTLGIKCYNAEQSSRFYLANNKALNYCLNEGYDVKVG